MSEKNTTGPSGPIDGNIDDMDLPTYDPETDTVTDRSGSRPVSARRSGGARRIARPDTSAQDASAKDVSARDASGKDVSARDASAKDVSAPNQGSVDTAGPADDGRTGGESARRRPRRTDPYALTGRAAPQSIPPREAEADTELFPAPAAGSASHDDPVETAGRAEPVDPGGRPDNRDLQDRHGRQDLLERRDRSERLASDAPTSVRDEPVAADPKAPAGHGAGATDPAGAENATRVLGAAGTAPTAAPAAVSAAAGHPGPTADGAEIEQPAVDHPVTAPGDLGGLEEEDDGPDHRRGTTDFGLLLLRVVVSAALILHALAVFFRLGGGDGLAGLEAEYAAYPWAGVLAVAVPAAELAAGVFLLLGLITPLFAAVGTVAVGFTALHQLVQAGGGLNPFAWPAAVWLPLVLGGAVIALQFTGPGTWSVDRPRGWSRRPLASSWVFFLLAVAALAALWWFGAAVNPF